MSTFEVETPTAETPPAEDSQGSSFWNKFKRRHLCICACIEFVVLVLVVVLLALNPGPYWLITGNNGFIWPENYGKVQERTIWLYWNSHTLPEHLQLMMEAMEHNKGSFDVRLVTPGEVEKYVSRTELPVRWKWLGPAQQKDALMNALLARYGGVAFDASVVLFEPLDTWWDEMVANRTIFRGFMYDHMETAVWFLMSRAGGLFGHAVANQVIGLGSSWTSNHYDKGNQGRYFAMGDGTVTPVIGRYDYSKRKCFGPRKEEGICSPPLPAEDVPELGRELLMISSPTSGPQLPYAFEDGHNFMLWEVSKNKDKWSEFKRRRSAGLMPFVKAFSGGGAELKKMKKAEIIKRKGTFLCYFLCLAGTNQCGIDCASERVIA